MTEPIRLEFMDGLRMARDAVQRTANGVHAETYVPGGEVGLAAALEAIDKHIAWWEGLIAAAQPVRAAGTPAETVASARAAIRAREADENRKVFGAIAGEGI